MRNPAGVPGTFRTATPVAVRAVNRAILLDLIRQRGPISRADLAKTTGLFRSTVSDICEQLLAENLVFEDRELPNVRGRPALSLNDDAVRVLGWVLHPELCQLAVGGLSGRPQYWIQFPTPADPAKLGQCLREAIDFLEFQVDAKTHKGYSRLGVAVWGHVDPISRQVSQVMGRPEWGSWNLVADLQRSLDLKIDLGTAGMAGVMSELWSSAGDSERDFAFLIVGDHDIASGIYHRDGVWRGGLPGVGLSVGHMPVGKEDIPCECGRLNCWRAMVSHAALWNRFRAPLPWNPRHFRQLLYSFKDRAGREAIEHQTAALARGLTILDATWTPSRFVLAGFAAEHWDGLAPNLSHQLELAGVTATLQRARYPADLPILQGALCLALEPMFSVPQFGQKIVSMEEF